MQYLPVLLYGIIIYSIRTSTLDVATDMTNGRTAAGHSAGQTSRQVVKIVLPAPSAYDTVSCTVSAMLVLFLLVLSPYLCNALTHVSLMPRELKRSSRRLCTFHATTPNKDDGDENSTVASASASAIRLISSGIEITESSFRGAGEPRPDLSPEELPVLLMEALRLNDFPHVDSGLQSVWAFCGDTTRHLFQNNMTDFIVSAHDTANEFPTSFYGNALHGRHWELESKLNRIMGMPTTTTNPSIPTTSTRPSGASNDKDSSCWIATQVIKTISSDGRMRRWQWELRRNRRPPNLNCWFVESIGSSDRKGNFEAE